MIGNEILYIATSISVPVIVLSWVACLAYCVYRHVAIHEARQATAVTVMVGDCSASANPAVITRSTPLYSHSSGWITASPRPDPLLGQFAPATSTSRASMTLADVLRNTEGGLDDSLGPVYYPKYPVSNSRLSTPLHPDDLRPSPMAPLQPPWPHLPPIHGKGKGGKKGGRPTQHPSVLSFLNSSVVNSSAPGGARENTAGRGNNAAAGARSGQDTTITEQPNQNGESQIRRHSAL